MEKFLYFYYMNTIREHSLTKAFTLITGVVFLNMSFFLAEVSMLEYNKKELIEIAKLILNTGFEEERDGATSGADSMGKEVDLATQHQLSHQVFSLISIETNRILVDHYRHANHSLTFFPPPDLV
ncbi:MAG: hypothetical protein ABIR06_21030 [Cyclobacteriaceae bacterium]